MKERQRRMPDTTTQQVDSPEPMIPVVTPEIFNVPQGDASYEDDFAVYLEF